MMRFLSGFALVLCLLAEPVAAADWLGANTTSGTSAQTNVDDPALWSTSLVPSTGDSAVFNWTETAEAHLNITAASVFNPDGSLELLTPSAFSGAKSLFIDKDLTLTTLRVTVPINVTGGNSTTTGNYINRVRIGQQWDGAAIISTAKREITLTSNTPFDVVDGSFATIRTALGSSFKLQGSDIVLQQLSQTALRGGLAGANDDGVYGINGGGPIENATLTGSGQVRFEAVGGNVTIESAGTRTDGTFAIGFMQLHVRSDQTWESSPTGFIRLAYRVGVSGGLVPSLVTAIDNQPLDNLGEVNLVVDGNQNSGSAATNLTAMRIEAGTYGSLHYRNGASRFTYFNLNGNVTFAGNAVIPGVFNNNGVGNVEASTIPYGLYIQSGNGTNTTNMGKRVRVAGFTLTTTNGILLEDNFGPAASAAQVLASQAIIDAATANSIVNIGGDLNYLSVSHAGSTEAPARGIGIAGGSTTTVNLAGHFITNVASIATSGYTQGLSTSTLNLIGGDASFKTFEVADAANKAAVANGYGIGVLNIGNGAIAGKVDLVNNQINDNLVVAAINSVDGEKLMAGELRINAGSTLRLNAETVVVGTSLLIDETGTLDLNSGLTLQADDLVPFFVGLGDQTATWSTFSANVIDGTTGATFAPTLSEGNTYWQVTSVPEPASMGLLIVAGFALGRRRRAK